VPRRDILMVDPDNFTPYYNTNLCEALAQKGWTVELLTSAYSFESIPGPLNVTVNNIFYTFKTRHEWLTRHALCRRGLKALLYPHELSKLKSEIARRAPGILHVQWALMPFLDKRLWRWCQDRGWRIVFTAHEAARDSAAPRPMPQPGVRDLLRLADATIVHSRRERQAIIELDVGPDRVHVIPDGPAGTFQGPMIDKHEARRVLGLPLESPTILFFGLIKPYKGLHVLLQALPKIQATIPCAHLAVAGEPKMPLAGLLRRSQAAGIYEHVTWRLGYVPTTEAALWFSAADVVALPYLSGAGSGVLPRALGFGRAVVASAVGAMSEIVEPNVTGELVPPNDPDALASALIGILSSPLRIAALGEAACRHSIERCSWGAIAAKTDRVYLNVS
jgi:glycosyltransferase involved in cell wall biosynthesis